MRCAVCVEFVKNPLHLDGFGPEGAVGGRFPEATGLDGPYINPGGPEGALGGRFPEATGPGPALYLAPWSRVERCCTLARGYLSAWVLSQFVLQKQRAAAVPASSGGWALRARVCVR